MIGPGLICFSDYIKITSSKKRGQELTVDISNNKNNTITVNKYNYQY